MTGVFRNRAFPFNIKSIKIRIVVSIISFTYLPVALFGVVGYFLFLVNEKPIATLTFLLCLFFTNGWNLLYSDFIKLKTYAGLTIALIKEKVGRTVWEDTFEGEHLVYKFLLHLEFTIDGIEYSQRYTVEDEYYSYYKGGDFIKIRYIPGDLRFIIFNGSPYGHIDPDPDEFFIDRITRKGIFFLLAFIKDESKKIKIGKDLCLFLSIIFVLLALIFAFVF